MHLPGSRLLPALLLLVPFLHAQDAAYDLPPRTVTVAPTPGALLGPHAGEVPDLRVFRPEKQERVRQHPIPEGKGGNPEPASPPVRLSGVVPIGPGDFKVFANTQAVPAGANFGWPAEPVTVIDRDVAFLTANMYAAHSIDSGQTWAHWNPFTFFNPIDGGFNGDQRLAHVPARGMTVWILQYAYAVNTQNGSHRIAVARSHDDLKNGVFTVYDVNPQTFGDPAGRWLDFPDVTVGDNFLYGSTNVIPGGGGTGVNTFTWRVSLAELQAGGNVTFAFYTGAQTGPPIPRLCQNTGNTLWAAMRWSTTQIRLLWWPETGNLSFEQKTTAQTANATANGAGPDGRDWLGNDDHRMLGAAAGNGEVVFMFSSGPTGSRTRNFVRIERISTATRAITGEEDLWTNDFALSYPAIAPNRVGHYGVTVALGGGNFYPGTYGFIVDNYAPGFAGQALNPFAAGDTGPAAGNNRWGDYFGVTPHPYDALTWIASAKCLTGGPNPANTNNRFVWFGREQNEPAWVGVTVTSTGLGQVPIQVGQTDRFGQRNGQGTFVRSYAPGQGLTLTAPARMLVGTTVYPLDRWVRNGSQQAQGNPVLDIGNLGTARTQTMEARYVVPATLAVSSLPGQGAFVQMSPLDLAGNGGGFTSFSRSYLPNTAVTLTAPLQLGNDVFLSWTLNGTPQPLGQRAINVNAVGHSNLVAQYVSAAILDVSSFPAQGASITVSPLDLGGLGNGITPFTRRYGGNTQATLTAPATFNGMTFAQWTVQGNPQPVGQRTINVTVNLVQICVAVYVQSALGPTWVQQIPAASPGIRQGAGMAFDPSRGRTILFGGIVSAVLNDTWEYDGANWTQRSTATNPPGRYLFGMAQDTGRRRTVVFGGSRSGSWLADTWEYDGVDWSDRSPATGPSQRFGAALAYDGARQRTVLFGGSNNVTPFNDTWEWDGTSWTQRFPSVSPPARFSHRLAYDAVRQRTVLFGGGATSTLNDTWEWDGTNWAQKNPSTPPPVRSAFGMAFDGNRARVLVFGGAGSGGQIGDTWEWDGTNWAQRVTLGSPVPRAAHAMAFDALRGRTVLFGGVNVIVRNDTWEYFAPCDVVGAGHPGGGLPIGCTGAPVLGTNFCVGFPSALGIGVLVLGQAPPLFPPIAIGPPVACAQGSVFEVPLLAFTTSGSPANMCFPLPLDPALHGAAFLFQGFSVESGSCVRATDAMAVLLQKP